MKPISDLFAFQRIEHLARAQATARGIGRLRRMHDSGEKSTCVRAAHAGDAKIVWYTSAPMSVPPEGMRPAKIWRLMSPELRAAASTAFWTDEQAALERAEAVALIARHIKFRPKSVLALPVEKKARYLAGLAQVSDLLAARLLVSYHLEHQRPMMAAFLDELGIAHENGLIATDSPTAPAPETLDGAVVALVARFPRDDVARYFWTLLWQDAETWAGLKDRAELEIS